MLETLPVSRLPQGRVPVRRGHLSRNQTWACAPFVRFGPADRLPVHS
ncbi:Hypothetical protein CAP_8684 [Chondromyces apiculatus DSM 436]|uniref:Uncharacterized protein n=1 Tax=Chondromyces apiculatus DSM 436 TaxID=1192034 RepID=A0A017TG72_9BACT|nr:Hypothetical protein CAP_8684 [Chondromyces apiculatus DSM 436]